MQRNNDATYDAPDSNDANFSNDASDATRLSIDKFASLLRDYHDSRNASEVPRVESTQKVATSSVPPPASPSESSQDFTRAGAGNIYSAPFGTTSANSNRDVSETVRQVLAASRNRLANRSEIVSPRLSPNVAKFPGVETQGVKIPASIPQLASSGVPSVAVPSASTSLENLVGVSQQPTISPEDFFADVSFNQTSIEPTPGFDALSIAPESANASPENFLERLNAAGAIDGSSNASAEELEFLRERSTLEKATDNAPMWLASLFAHALLVLTLAFIVVKVDTNQLLEIISEPGFTDQVVLDEVFDPEAVAEENQETEFDATNIDVQTETIADVPDVSAFHDESSATLALAESSLGLEPVPAGEITNWLGSLNGDDLAGRGEAKAVALATGGGTEGSEKAVALALAWLAEHQLPNGAWTFQLDRSPTCGGRCANAGSNTSINAATAMGLLPFLAAGHTPTTGKYKKVVAKGLNYLTEAGTKSENGLGYNDSGNMYAHGLATIALCETYAMLKPREKNRYRELGYIAQDALNFIAYAQADDGGWRYTPKQAGDTSVFGWQMMALKSGQLGGLDVSNEVVRDARDFLQDVVGFDYGSRYYYCNNEGSSNATDSIGLLCRLYLDWRVDNPQLLTGAARLSAIGPQPGNPYYNYYATQLFHNIGGEMWSKWNGTMRDALIKSQCMEGHERGSWFPEGADSHCKTGGRLYATSLNCMILEVYYRHMPLYQKLENGSQFPLEVPTQ